MRKVHAATGFGIILSIMMVLGTGITASAETNISGIRITFTDTYDSGEDETRVLQPEITTSDSKYSISDVAWSKDWNEDMKKNKWIPGKEVTATITLDPEDGYKFSGSYGKSSCKIYGASYTSSKVSDGSLIVKVKYIPVAKLGQTEKAGWGDSTKRKAVWKKVDFADAYQVRLYSEDVVKKTLTVYTNSVDLTSYMNQDSRYYYEVRAIAKDSAERKYLKDGEFATSEDTVVDNLGDTSGVWRKYQSGNKYIDEDGNAITNSWKLISGKWYYFNHEGYAVSGWQYLDHKWYYFNTDYSMQIGWILIEGKWYYLNQSGDMATGWTQVQPGFWYYLDSNGVMQTGWIMVNEAWYYLDAAGLMAANTVIDGYSVGPDGAMIHS